MKNKDLLVPGLASFGNFIENDVMQGHHFSLLQHETEKLRNDIEKMRSELRSDLRSYFTVVFCLFPCQYVFAFS